MTSWIPISRSAHAKAHWQKRNDYNFVSKDQVAYVLLNEMSKLLPQFALGFLKKADSFNFIALLGVDGNRNLYVGADGKWLGNYIPAAFRGYPFALADNEEGGKIFCIEESCLSEDSSADSLFDKEGNLTKHLEQVVDFLKQCDMGNQQTKQACDALAAAGLIEEWPLTVSRGEQSPAVKIEGLYRVNERALQELAVDSIAKLRNCGALHLAFAQLFSMNQVELLSQRAEHFEKTATTPVPLEGVGELFQDSGVLNFDSLNFD